MDNNIENNETNNVVTTPEVPTIDTPVEETSVVETPVAQEQVVTEVTQPVESAPVMETPPNVEQPQVTAPVAEATPVTVTTPVGDSSQVKLVADTSSNKKNTVLVIILVIALLAIGGYGVYYFMSNKEDAPVSTGDTTRPPKYSIGVPTSHQSTESTTTEGETTEAVTIPTQTTVLVTSNPNKRKPTSEDHTKIVAIIDKDFPLTTKENTQYQIAGSLTEQQLYDNFVASWEAYNPSTFSWGDGSFDYSVINLKADNLNCTDTEYNTELYKSNTTGKIDKIRISFGSEEYIITIK